MGFIYLSLASILFHRGVSLSAQISHRFRCVPVSLNNALTRFDYEDNLQIGGAKTPSVALSIKIRIVGIQVHELNRPCKRFHGKYWPLHKNGAIVELVT